MRGVISAAMWTAYQVLVCSLGMAAMDHFWGWNTDIGDIAFTLAISAIYELNRLEGRSNVQHTRK